MQDCFDNIPAGLYRATLEGRLVYCNQHFAELFGYDSRNALKGLPVVELFHQKRDRGAMIQALLRQGQVIDLPIRYRKRDGSAMWCCLSANLVFDDDGMATLLDGLLRPTPGHWPVSTGILGPDSGTSGDLTEGVIIASLDLKGRIIDINQPGLALFNLPGDQVYGRRLFSLIDPDYKDLYLLFLSDLFRLGEQETLLRIKDAHGRQRQLTVQASLVTHAGQPHHIKAAARDVTRQVARRRRTLRRQKLQGVLEMAGGVAHRMSQPLTIITNVVQEMRRDREDGLDDLSQARLERLCAQVDELNTLIRKVKRIDSYAATEYVNGQMIIDLERSSGMDG